MPGLVPWNLRSLWRWWVLHGSGWVWWMVSWNSNMFTRFGFEQITCQQNAMFLADVGWKSLCLDVILVPKQHFVYSRTNWRLPSFGVKFLMCASKIVLQLLLFFSHSSWWLRPCLPSWARRSTPHFMDFWFDFIGLIDFIVLIDWLLCVHLMSCFHFRMLRLEGKSGERFLV